MCGFCFGLCRMIVGHGMKNAAALKKIFPITKKSRNYKTWLHICTIYATFYKNVTKKVYPYENNV